MERNEHSAHISHAVCVSGVTFFSKIDGSFGPSHSHSVRCFLSDQCLLPRIMPATRIRQSRIASVEVNRRTSDEFASRSLLVTVRRVREEVVDGRKHPLARRVLEDLEERLDEHADVGGQVLRA